MNHSFKEYINAWLLKAEHDIMSSERLLEIEPVILDSACFHCQQAIEKSLKAFLCYHGNDVKKTHEIDFLLSECAVFDSVFGTIDSLNISDYAVQGRYPDSSLMPDVAEGKAYYQLAVQINKLVKDRIVFSE